jgi:hypothetical protein
MFWRYLVQTWDVIVGSHEILCGFHYSFRENSRSAGCLETGHDYLIPNPYQFTIHNYLHISFDKIENFSWNIIVK